MSSVRKMLSNTNQFKRSALSFAICSVCTLNHNMIMANEEVIDKEIEVIEVTGSRRLSTVQSLPINIGALDADTLDNQHIGDLVDAARWLPGLTVVDQGGFYRSPIIVRGLNTNTSGPSNDGGTVATYLNDIPLAIDLKLIDVERIEVLIGPQGTLYGAGTLGGAIRYITKKPQLDETSGELYGEWLSIKESDDTGSELGFVFNHALVEGKLAIRAAFNYLDNPGFIDNRFLLIEPGVSLPDPDLNDPEARENNFTTQKDINTEEVLTAKIALRFQPTDKLDINLAYHYQQEDFGGRSLSNFESLNPNNPIADEIGRYDSAFRYLEPRENTTSLLSLELLADLGFAELTSATGVSEYDSSFQRDQTDLLIGLNYGYEEFPAFSAFVRDEEKEDIFTQEIRLVSNNESKLSWIAGAFYNNADFEGESREFTPGFSQFAVDNFGADQLRPDDLEFVGLDQTKTIEQAIFGEVTFAFTEKLSATLGARFYRNKITFTGPIAIPQADTLFNGAGQDDINFFADDTFITKDTGNLFKFNLHYQWNDTVLSYFTISEGFRLGGNNGFALCDENITTQCALASEFDFEPDTTVNYELGYKSTWYKNKFHFNAALFHIQWRDAQVTSSTTNGSLPFISNAGSAESTGIELSTRVIITNELSAYVNATYTDARLTEDVPFLFGEQFDIFDEPVDGSVQSFFDGEKDDRLPGTPQKQLSAGLTYSTEIFNNQLLDLNYGLTYQSNVYTTVGLKDNGEKLPGYALSNFSAKLTNNNWALTFYVDNVFNKYSPTSVRNNPSNIGLARDDVSNDNRGDIQRRYSRYILTPRTIGLRLHYTFD